MRSGPESDDNGLAMRTVSSFAIMLFLIVSRMTVWAGGNTFPSDSALPGEGPSAQDGVFTLPMELDNEGSADWLCLRSSYPQIKRMEADVKGLWLVLDGGVRVLYAGATGMDHTSEEDFWVTDVRSSMADPYPLESERPDTPRGTSPGRRRSYAFLQAVYGRTPAAVKAQLRPVSLLGKTLWLAEPAAEAVRRANVTLISSVAEKPSLKPFLKAAGGFQWRRIAAEKRLSPHAFGIAFDISPDVATYWRWCSLRPHPMQKSYPEEIVRAFENEGFIWGGKWHEYDLMHFEYRPEIVCKARIHLTGKAK